MSLPMHLVPSLDGAVLGGGIEVTGDEAHHAVAVRRLRVGESVLLTDGRGRVVRGRVTSTGKRVFALDVDRIDRFLVPTPELVVVQAVPKGDRGELAVEVLTEIGVARVVPWAASRSVAIWKGERGEKALARWRTTAREAAKQARRAWQPEVTELMTTDEVADLVGSSTLAIVLHEEATTALSTLAVPGVGSVLIVVGPEGGLTEHEVETFVAAGAHSVRLGTEVLRTSTAGLAAAAAVLSRTARWRTG